MTKLDPTIVKQVFQKHGLTEPCPVCNDNHVPVQAYQERRCKANVRRACVCCGPCSEKCGGEP